MNLVSRHTIEEVENELSTTTNQHSSDNGQRTHLAILIQSLIRGIFEESEIQCVIDLTNTPE